MCGPSPLPPGDVMLILLGSVRLSGTALASVSGACLVGAVCPGPFPPSGSVCVGLPVVPGCGRSLVLLSPVPKSDGAWGLVPVVLGVGPPGCGSMSVLPGGCGCCWSGPTVSLGSMIRVRGVD